MAGTDALVARSVREFIASVASTAEPVPAGGSVAALTGAASAALLALVGGLLERKAIVGAAELLDRARELQERLLGLVDADADAYRAYLETKRSAGATQIPLAIAAACVEVVKLSCEVEAWTTGPLLGDVRAARSLANAGLAASLEIAEQNVVLHTDPAVQARLRADIARLTAAR